MKTFFALFVLVCWTQPAHAGFELPKGQPCVTIPFRLSDNRAVYDVMIDGKGPFHFIFDTGANSILDAAVARELGVALDEAGQTGGAGAGTQTAWRTRLKHVSFGGIEGKDTEFMALDLSAIRKTIGFSRLDGLMGREVLAQFLVRYDFDAAALAICNPDTAPDSMRAGTAVPFDWTDIEIPVVTATIDGVTGKFIVDTGDRSSLTLFGPFADRHGLRGKYPRKVSTITGQGVGGPIPADVVKAGSLQFSAFSIRHVTTRMPTLKTGGFATESLAGSIGNGVMRRFNATFDYRTRTMYLQPNGSFGKPDRYDRSGLWLVGGHALGFTVEAVAAGGAAAQAGIAPGEVVIAVDGVAAHKLSLIDLRDRLMDQPVGTNVRLTLQNKAGDRREAMIVLADQI